MFKIAAFALLIFKVTLFAEMTLSIIKPDGVEDKHIGEIITRFEKNGLKIAGIKMMKLSDSKAKEFYAVHQGRPFYPELVKFMSSGPLVAIVLEGDNAISKNRELMGATDPKDAIKGTIRADFARSKSQNAVHGSDSPENAKTEIHLLFSQEELFLK